MSGKIFEGLYRLGLILWLGWILSLVYNSNSWKLVLLCIGVSFVTLCIPTIIRLLLYRKLQQLSDELKIESKRQDAIRHQLNVEIEGMRRFREKLEKQGYVGTDVAKLPMSQEEKEFNASWNRPWDKSRDQDT